MKKFVRVSLFGILFLLAAGRTYAQSNVKVKSLEDSATLLNYKHVSSSVTPYDLTLDFEDLNGQYAKVQVNWGDGNMSNMTDITSPSSLKLKNHYNRNGCFPIEIYFYDSGENLVHTQYAWALNADLSLSYTLSPVGKDESGGCLSFGADTLLLCFGEHNNPPLTDYYIRVETKVPMLVGNPEDTLTIQSPSDIDLASNWVHACWANQVEGRRDSVWLIFTEATGFKGTEVSVGMTCGYTNAKGEPDFLNEESETKLTIRIFDKPDIRQIFRQKSDIEPFPDTLHAISDSLFFNVCAPGGPNEFGISGDWLAKYQTKVLSKPSPERNDTSIFKVDCYYTEDSVWSDITPANFKWSDVTGNSEYYNDTTMTFSRAGFYMVRWEIHNQCDEEHPDTLWTSLIRKDNSDEYYDDKFRYIRVYENHEANLDYLGDSVFCLNVKDSVILVDRNRRKFYDKPPKYSLTVINQDTRAEIEEPRELELAETKIYKGGKVINTPDAGDISAQGCDSTTIRLDFKEWGPGNYEVTLGRKGEGCDDERTKTFEFHVGDVPEIRDTISHYCYDKDGVSTINDKGMYHCGSYKFKVPDLSDAFDAKNRNIDSVRYQFTKGTKDSILVYKQEEGVPENASFLFDSTDNALNYILVNVYNGCGVSKTDSVGFYTPVDPKFTVWRDSVEVAGTDTLCLNAEYKYYLHGDLPESYEDSVYFSGGTVWLNGTSIVGGSSNFSKLRKANENYGSVKYTTKGEYTEKYKVVNKDFPACATSLEEKVVIMDAPDASIYKNDSVILYCASIDTLDTRVLFNKEEDAVFNRVTWEGWKGEVAVNDEKFPKLLFRDGKNDTLYVSTIQSTNCYFRDTLIFKPQPVPQANFAAFENFCVPDTLRKEDFLGVVHGNWDEIDSVKWDVYKNVHISDSLVYGIVEKSDNEIVKKLNGEIVLNEQSADSIRLIYFMQNIFNAPSDFMAGGCWSLDTLLVKVYKPQLEILKKDTLNKGDNGVYDLGRIQPKYLKIKDVQETLLTWTEGWDNHDGTWDNNMPPKYTLGENDKKLDSLQFVLTGKTNCDALITDTLIVYFPRIDITAHRDTICSNTTDYLLWGPGRTTGQFVDTTSLTWEIVKDASGGELLPATKKGSGVKYKPGTNLIIGDTVKIKVTGKSIADVGEKSDTILLWINPEPGYTDLQKGDTLIAIRDTIKIDKIKALNYQNVSGLKVEKIDQYDGWASIIGDSSIYFTVDPSDSKYTKNNRVRAEIRLKALPGCTDVVTPPLPMMDLLYPNVIPKYDPLDLCADEVYGVDSLVTFENDRKDRFTVWEWSNTGGGSWNNDTTVYKAGSTGGIGIETIKLAMNKRYIAYDSTTQWLLSSDAEREIKVNVHVKPIIGFNQNRGDRDTLCKKADKIEITRGESQPGASEWVLTQSYYVDSLRFNGQKLPADNNYAFKKGQGETDTVYITVNQGRCTAWDTVQKKLYLYRMDEVLDQKALQGYYEICEGGSVEIEYTGTLASPYWWVNVKATGTLDSLNKGLKPVYSDTSGVNGQVELHTTPHPGCEGEHIFTNIEVTKRPWLDLADKSICKNVGNDLDVSIVFAQGNSWSEADSITWYRKGETAKLGKTSKPGDSRFSYKLTAADIASDTFHLVAALWPKTPCDKSPTYDTVKIALSGQPEITLPSSGPAVCQGDTLDLIKQSGVTIKNAASVQWTNPSLGMVIADTLFVPGENDGSASLKITAKGVSGCADDVKHITVLVHKAPLPSFEVKTKPVCQKEEIELEAKGTSVTVESYQWKVENSSYSVATVKHTFEASGQVDVYLQQTYSYTGTMDRCERDTTKPVTVNPKPTADFEDVGQVAIGSTVTIHNTSTPADLKEYSWNVAGVPTPYTEKDVTLNFNRATSVGITLTVTTDAGCSDSKSGTVEVVEPPKADFEAKVDSCGNTAEFTFTGTLNGATVWWDWGKGQGFEQDVRVDMTQPITKSYDVGHQDTTYWVTLELRNAADTVRKNVPVRFISRLDASFEILPEKSGCHEIYRTIEVKIEGKNDAGYVIWGDKWYNPDSKMDSVPFTGNITLLKHRFENSLYPSPVLDTIRLHVRNACFAVADTDYLTVLPASVSAEIELLNGSSLCFQDDVLKVRNASIGFDKATAVWEWKFESGNNVWEQSKRDTATHRYLSPGRYTVMLRISDQCNDGTDSLEITVKGNDSLWFEMLSEPYCTGQTVTMKFVQKGTPEFSDLRWTIYEQQSGRSLKIGADSTQLSYKFTEAGDYGVLLSGKADGCEDRQTLPLHINETPVAMISLVPGSKPVICEPDAVEFQAADGSGLSRMPHILWDFRNGVKSSELREKVVFEKEGIYNVSLTLESEAGCVSRDSMEITVKHTPRISFVTDDSLYCTQNGTFEVAVDNTSEDMDRCRFEWFKKVGAGSEESIGLQPQFSSPLLFENVSGVIGLRLFATDLQTGCVKDFTKEIVASEAVKAHIFKEAEHVCLDNPVYFASRTESNVAKVEWNMGNGEMSVDTAFEYTYDRVGDKMITLRVENEDGCYDSDTLSITVYPLPVADFEWEKNSGVVEGYPDTLDLPEVDNGGVEFTNYSTVTPDDWGTELYYSWNFGDSTTMNAAKNPTHRFENNGLYEVWLKATTAYGCVDSVVRTVSIDAVKGLYIPTAFAPAMPDEDLGEGNSYMGSARFQPKGIGLYSYQIQVYDPWSGTCVWSSTALKDGQPAEYWDGKFNGADAPAGNYIWKVNAIFIDGSVWQNEKGAMEGLVMLIR